MTNSELQELLKQYPDDSLIMISVPRENAYNAGEVIDGTCYEFTDEDEEEEKEVAAIYIQAVWEH